MDGNSTCTVLTPLTAVSQRLLCFLLGPMARLLRYHALTDYSGLQWVPDEQLIQVISKHEPPSPDPQHHGHLTALSISPSHRGLGLARYYMDMLESTTDSVGAYFVDLFVRCNNKRAVELYEKLGYSVYRRVVEWVRFSAVF